MHFRIGQGYDVHQLVESRELFIGGVKVPFSKGSLGHSDGDVLIHAVCDAMLGALALSDIGHYFKNTDSKWKGMSSFYFLSEVNHIIQNQGYEIGNLDSTIVLEAPKLENYVAEIRMKLGDILEIPIEKISVKATTSESLGFVGKGKGIEAYAICLLIKKEK